jgi:hypothetical protein
MNCQLLENLATVRCAGSASTALGVSAEELRLRRSWPTEDGRLILEYLAGGEVVAGQWHGDSATMEEALSKTLAVSPTAAIVSAGATQVLLQAKGADAKLRSLSGLQQTHDGALIAHRAERRATLRCETSSGTEFLKVLRPSKLSAIVKALRLASDLVGTRVVLPEIRWIDEGQGVMASASLPGESLHDLGPVAFMEASDAVGATLREFHRAGTQGASTHDAMAEARVLREAHRRLRAFVPSVADDLRTIIETTSAELESTPRAPSALLHRDFHDKQVIRIDERRIGLLDVDLVAAGEPELDVGNWSAHLLLKVLQGLLPASELAPARAAFQSGYGPGLDPARVRLYLRASISRLACLYAFRPSSVPVVALLVQALVQDIT